MRVLSTFLFLMATLPLYSQKVKVIEPAILECQYDLQMVKDTISRNIVSNDIMVLRIGKNASQFFSRYTYLGDSLIGSSNGAQEFGKLFMDKLSKGNTASLPGVKTTTDYIFKNYPQGSITTRTNDRHLSAFTFREEYKPQSWNILDSTKQVLDYPCQLATCSYRGRIFYAWFTADIPISNGPWKLSGLPGLILEAYDKEHHYHYTLRSIKQSGLDPVTLYNLTDEKFEKTDRITFLRNQRRLFDSSNPMADIEAATGITIEGGASPSPKKQKAYDFIERDYR